LLVEEKVGNWRNYTRGSEFRNKRNNSVIKCIFYQLDDLDQHPVVGRGGEDRVELGRQGQVVFGVFSGQLANLPAKKENNNETTQKQQGSTKK